MNNLLIFLLFNPTISIISNIGIDICWGLALWMIVFAFGMVMCSGGIEMEVVVGL
jgi:hypothetical protein